MKIRAPGSSAPRIPSVRTNRAEAPAVREARTEAGAGPCASQPASTIAARLRSAEIAPREAVALLVDDTVGRLEGASPALRAQLRKTLQKIASEDPTLLALLDRTRR